MSPARLPGPRPSPHALHPANSQQSPFSALSRRCWPCAGSLPCSPQKPHHASNEPLHTLLACLWGVISSNIEPSFRGEFTLLPEGSHAGPGGLAPAGSSARASSVSLHKGGVLVHLTLHTGDPGGAGPRGSGQSLQPQVCECFS
uniref:Uncharacterized protein n=1 Tax=Molossus molossus TaxID=27622 RepID=A0A7J8G0T7_MOLMO|nr:hypothetical protein HJG59_008283 [Molossus molossus]